MSRVKQICWQYIYKHFITELNQNCPKVSAQLSRTGHSWVTDQDQHMWHIVICDHIVTQNKLDLIWHWRIFIHFLRIMLLNPFQAIDWFKKYFLLFTALWRGSGSSDKIGSWNDRVESTSYLWGQFNFLHTSCQNDIWNYLEKLACCYYFANAVGNENYQTQIFQKQTEVSHKRA